MPQSQSLYPPATEKWSTQNHQKNGTTQLLSDDWKRWIATNKLLNIPDGAIVQSLVKNGIDIRIAIEEVNAVAADPYFQAGSNLLINKVKELEAYINYQNWEVKKLSEQLDIYRKLDEVSPTYGKIERQSRLSRAEFLENYYAKNTPVILTDIMGNWQALSLWTPEYLKQKYGEVSIEVQANRESSQLYELEKTKYKKKMLFGEYIDRIVSSGPSNDYYIVATNNSFFEEKMQGLLQDIEMFPEYLDESLPGHKPFLWFGPAGTITPLHHDPINVLLCQVRGRKRVRLISPNQKHLLYNHVFCFSQVDLENPDYDRYPLFKNVNIIDTVLEPGEALFIPVGWWHHVNSLDLAISVSFINFVFPNHYE